MATHTEKDFEQLLNEIYGPVNITGHDYESGYAIKLVDPIMFRESYLEWLDQSGVAGEFPEIDFDTLPEDTEDCELISLNELKDFNLVDHRDLWDDVVVVLKDGTAIHIIDSSNMDEYEYDEQSGLFSGPYGPEMCAGCVDCHAYVYKPVSHTWELTEDPVYEYYPMDTLESFLKRNQFI